MTARISRWAAAAAAALAIVQGLSSLHNAAIDIVVGIFFASMCALGLVFALLLWFRASFESRLAVFMLASATLLVELLHFMIGLPGVAPGQPTIDAVTQVVLASAVIVLVILSRPLPRAVK
jgi:hypothetical protein